MHHVVVSPHLPPPPSAPPPLHHFPQVRRGVKLVNQVPRDLPSVLGDTGRIIQVSPYLTIIKLKQIQVSPHLN